MPKTCPKCSKPVPDGAKSSPFCSSRCQLTDLGAWLTEGYRIPADADDEDQDRPRPPTMPPPDGEQ